MGESHWSHAQKIQERLASNHQERMAKTLRRMERRVKRRLVLQRVRAQMKEGEGDSREDDDGNDRPLKRRRAKKVSFSVEEIM